MKRPSLAFGPKSEAQKLLAQLAAELGLTGSLHTGLDPHGRPTLCSDGRTLALSRSRAGGFCAVALALDGRVGVDLVDPDLNDPSLLEAHFHPTEQSWLKERQGNTRTLTTARCWAAKEAVLKALGLGLGFGIDSVELLPEGHDGLRVVRIAGQSAEGWNLEISEEQGLVLALAWAP